MSFEGCARVVVYPVKCCIRESEECGMPEAR